MNEVMPMAKLISYCGMYCGSCPMYQKKNCIGCKYEETQNCEIKKCCIEKKYSSCARCKDVKEYKDCKKLNNFSSKLFGFIFRMDKFSSLELLKSKGQKKYSAHMAENNLISLKKY